MCIYISNYVRILIVHYDAKNPKRQHWLFLGEKFKKKVQSHKISENSLKRSIIVHIINLTAKNNS